MRHVGPLLALLALGSAAGCAQPEPLTEIFLSVDTDMAVRDGIAPPVAAEVIRLDVLLDDEPDRTGFTAILDEAYRDHVDPPVTWGILAATDPEREIEIVARAFERGAGEPALVEQRARVRFVPGEVRVLCLELTSACASREEDCPDGTTCRAEGGETSCVSIHVDEDRLPAYEDPEPRCPDGWPGR